MNVLKYSSAFLMIVSIGIGCQHKQLFSENLRPIPFEDLQIISFEISGEEQKLLQIIDSSEKIAFVEQINTATFNGMWKVAHWDYIKLIYSQDTLKLRTNGKVFGTGEGDKYYNLPEPYTQYWKQ